MSFLFRFGYGDVGRARISSAARSIEDASFTTIEGREDMATQPIPEGYSTISPYLAVDDAAEAIAYYKKASAPRRPSAWTRPTGKSDMPSSRSATRT